MNFQEPREPKVENYSYYLAWIIESCTVDLKHRRYHTFPYISLHPGILTFTLFKMFQILQICL